MSGTAWCAAIRGVCRFISFLDRDFTGVILRPHKRCFLRVSDDPGKSPRIRAVEHLPVVMAHLLAGLRSPSGVGSRGQLIWPADQWYDVGMTTAKIAISLPKHQLARVHREVRAGRADSVSGYIASVLAEQEKRDSLRGLLRDLIEQHGEPAPEDIKWAERMLPRRRRG